MKRIFAIAAAGRSRRSRYPAGIRRAGWWLGAAVLACSGGGVSAEPAEYRLDPDHVVLAFLVEHIGFARVLGSFTEVEGSFEFDEATGELSELRVAVATASVASGNEERDEHLLSDDFLNTRRYPEMEFTAAGGERIGDDVYRIDGQLTLLGMTLPLSLEATLNKIGSYPMGRDAYALGVSARAELSRSAFGMDYAIDNGWVGDTVEILIEIEAQRE